jgi:hypothetical protein
MIFGYTRVSTIEQAAGNKSSLAEQERKIRGVALMRGEEIAEVFSDPGTSGSVPLTKRPAGGRLLASLNPGDIIVAAKLDRLFRSASDALTTVEQLQAKKIGVILADIGADVVTENGVSKLFFSMLAAFAEFERTRIAERMTDGRRNKAQRGGHIGGLPPFGYAKVGAGQEAVLVPNDDEQKIIREVKKLQGTPLRQISARLADMGYYDRAGTPFAAMQVKRILERENAA